jgi:peptidyl-prolyl cis-trans isomerase C
MRKILLLAVAATVFSGPAFAQTVAKVGGVSITLAQVIAADPAAKTDAATRNKVLVALVNRQAVLNEAKTSGLTQTSAYKAALAQAEANITINLEAQNFIEQNPVSAQKLAATYQTVFNKPAPVEYRFRQIMVSSFAAAQTIIGNLKNGQDFSILAAQDSQDASANVGGEVGWQIATQLPAPILQAFKTMKVAQVAGPISLPQGYDVVQLLGTRSAPKPTLDQVKGQLTNALQQQEWVAQIVKLRNAQGAQLIVPISGS